MKLILFMSLILNSGLVWSYGIGYSSHPLWTDQHLVTGEMTGVTSTGGGLGLQARYTRKLSKKVTLDAGAGLGTGERTFRAFVGGDFELFPDYLKQPRISLKGTLEHAREFRAGRTIISLAPTISKGINFWGHEAYPFFSLPIGLNLRGNGNTYLSQINASLGITGHLPFENYKHLLGNVELQVGLKDSFTALFTGVSYPLD